MKAWNKHMINAVSKLKSNKLDFSSKVQTKRSRRFWFKVNHTNKQPEKSYLRIFVQSPNKRSRRCLLKLSKSYKHKLNIKIFISILFISEFCNVIIIRKPVSILRNIKTSIICFSQSSLKLKRNCFILFFDHVCFRVINLTKINYYIYLVRDTVWSQIDS